MSLDLELMREVAEAAVEHNTCAAHGRFEETFQPDDLVQLLNFIDRIDEMRRDFQEACEAQYEAWGSRIRNGKPDPAHDEAMYQAQKKIWLAVEKHRPKPVYGAGSEIMREIPVDKENVLMIGGPYDGRFERVTPGQPEIVLWSRAKSDFDWPQSIMAHDPLKAMKLDMVTYRRHPVNSELGLSTAVYVLEGLDPLEELINGYRKP